MKQAKRLYSGKLRFWPYMEPMFNRKMSYVKKAGRGFLLANWRQG